MIRFEGKQLQNNSIVLWNNGYSISFSGFGASSFSLISNAGAEHNSGKYNSFRNVCIFFGIDPLTF
jgi:hypothetical protein